MTHEMIVLSSDTQTKPTLAMRQAMASAKVGDEQRRLDPTVNRLLDRVAELLGKEAALFLPSGTMCNLVAIKTHTRPTEVVFADHMAHTIRAESGGAALGSSVLFEPIPSDRGIFTPAALAEAVRKVTTLPWPYAPKPRLLCVEQTHNFGGGSVWTLDDLQAVCDCGRDHGLSIHMDGARLLNAVVAANTPAQEFAGCVDSVWIDFTKALGAPLGAVLAGPQAFIEEARGYKHLFGGALRQAGIVAAGCLYALDHHVERLAEDHANARHLAKGLSHLQGIDVRTPLPESNMVFFDVSGLGMDNATFLARLQQQNVEMGAVAGLIRAVTHLDVSRSDVDEAISAVAKVKQAHVGSRSP